MATNNAINNVRPTGFAAYLSASTTNDKTGDNTTYVPIFDTVQINDGSYNNGTGIYTVPTTGRYIIGATTTVTNLGAAHTSGTISIYNQTTGNSYPGNILNPYVISVSTAAPLMVYTITQFTAGDLININIRVAGSTKTVGIAGSGSPYSSYIYCYKVG